MLRQAQHDSKTRRGSPGSPPDRKQTRAADRTKHEHNHRIDSHPQDLKAQVDSGRCGSTPNFAIIGARVD
jgi:hypothetical protein